MRDAVEEAYRWRNTDHTSTLIITPNIHSLHYDYLFQTVAKQQSTHPPRTVVLQDDTQMILVLEQSGASYADYVVAQRKALTESTQWRRTRVKLFGMITLEEWQRGEKK
jgi:glycogen synthase